MLLELFVLLDDVRPINGFSSHRIGPSVASFTHHAMNEHEHLLVRLQELLPDEPAHLLHLDDILASEILPEKGDVAKGVLHGLRYAMTVEMMGPPRLYPK